MAPRAARIEKLDVPTCEGLKPEGKRYRVTDEACPRLKLNVEPDGRRWWSARYVTPDGRNSEKALGTFPATLPEAARKRARAVDAQKDVEDPAEAKRAKRREAQAERAKVAAAKANTFEALSEAYVAASMKGQFSHSGRPKAETTLAHERQMLRKHVIPALGARPVAEIRRREVADFLKRVASESGHGASNACLAVTRRVLAYACDRELLEVNPAREIRGIPTPTRDVVASDGALRSLWQALEEAKRDRTFKKAATKPSEAYATACVLQVSLLTLQRRGEVVRMRREDLDLERALWVIPKMHKKERRKGVVPLSPWAVRLISEALERSGGSAWVFPGMATDKDGEAEHVKPKTITRFLARLRERDVERRAAAQARIKAGEPLPGDVAILEAPALGDITPHDLRRTGRTRLTGEELQIDEATAERVLNHSVGSRQQNAYDMNTYVAPKRRALSMWAEELARIVEGRELPSNVVSLQRA